MRYHNWQWRQQVKAGKASPLIRSTYQGRHGDHWWCPPWTIHLVHMVRNSWTDSPLEEYKISVEPFRRGLPSDALPLSLDYLMADRGIHAGTRRERDRENNGLFHSRDNSVIPIFWAPPMIYGLKWFCHYIIHEKLIDYLKLEKRSRYLFWGKISAN